MYGLSIKKIKAWRGDPKKVTLSDLDWTDKIDAKMKLSEFVQKHDLKVSEFGWWLVSYWG